MSVDESEWTFFSHYAHVLICLAENPRIRLRDLADRIGVTERTAMRLIDRLDRAGVVRRTRHGRRNYYEIDTRGVLQHPIEPACTVEHLLRVVMQAGEEQAARSVPETDGIPERRKPRN